MVYEAKEEGTVMDRVPLSGREYSALQTLFAIVSGFTAGLDFLQKRSETAGCWDDLQRVGELSQECLDKILLTVPNQKLDHIRRNLANIRLHIKVEPPGLSTKTDEYSYVPLTALNDLLNHLCQTECSLCDKTAVEARKCPYRKIIDDAIPHEVEGKDREHCKYSDLVLGL